MSGARLFNYRQGDRSEYLAQYIISALGICIPVPRQEDIGFDFYCSISENESGLLTFSHPFILQIKSSFEDLGIGGIDKNNNWRQYEIEWLKKQSTPFLIGIVEKEIATISIYSSSSINFCFQNNLFPELILLKLRKEILGEKNSVHKPKVENSSNNIKGSDNLIHTVDLGPPVLELNIQNIKDSDFLRNSKKLLRACVQIENINITFRNILIPHFLWAKDIRTNKSLFPAWSISTHSIENNYHIFERISPIISSMAISAFITKDPLIGPLKELIKAMPQEVFYKELVEKFPDIFNKNA